MPLAPLHRVRLVTAGVLTGAVLLAGCSSSQTSSPVSGASGPPVAGGSWDCGATCDWSTDDATRQLRERYGATAANVTTGAKTASRESSGIPAGGVDDNATFSAYVDRRSRLAADTAGGGTPLLDLPLDRRHLLRVVNRDGEPVGGADIEVTDRSGIVVAHVRTHHDGRAVYLPPLGFAAPADPGPQPPGTTPGGTMAPVAGPDVGYGLRLKKGLFEAKGKITGAEEEVVVLDAGAPAGAPARPLDVVFVVDATGSMADELAGVQAALGELRGRLGDLPGRPDVHLGLVAYRDNGEQFVTRTFGLTGDADTFGAALRTVVADGGGDTPDDVTGGLRDAVARSGWRDEAVDRVIVLVGDAPPHLDDPARPPLDAAREAAAVGVRIVAVGGRGLGPVAEYAFRQMALLTRGRFVWLPTDGIGGLLTEQIRLLVAPAP